MISKNHTIGAHDRIIQVTIMVEIMVEITMEIIMEVIILRLFLNR